MMQVEVKLFAGFQKGRFAVRDWELDSGTTIQRVVDEMGIPNAEIGVMMVNGRHAKFDRELAAGDVLAIFPVIGGG